jgi:hypothetical protein
LSAALHPLERGERESVFWLKRKDGERRVARAASRSPVCTSAVWARRASRSIRVASSSEPVLEGQP